MSEGSSGNSPAEQTAAADARPPARLHCSGCGADLVFEPGLQALQCPYCGARNEIPQSEDAIVELDFEAHLSGLAQAADTEVQVSAKCPGCGAEVDKPAHIDTMICPFCAVTITARGTDHDRIRPAALLPFAVTRDEARAAFSRWVASLWFAPSKLRQYARRDDRLQGLYVPYWTYDADTISLYRGQRGEHYWVTEHYTETEHYTTTQNGQTVHRTRRVPKTRQVRKTRWYPASGTVFNSFNDLLVLASRSLPPEKAAALEPWDLHALVAYSGEYLGGFVSERYQVGLAEGFEEACRQMQPIIEATIRDDIGGDEQIISSMATERRNVTFKHVLLPVWISSYRFRGRLFRYLVNGRTGEVQGERPWSMVKIVLAVLTALAVVGAIWALTTTGAR